MEYFISSNPICHEKAESLHAVYDATQVVPPAKPQKWAREKGKSIP